LEVRLAWLVPLSIFVVFYRAATAAIFTLSLHDALPIFRARAGPPQDPAAPDPPVRRAHRPAPPPLPPPAPSPRPAVAPAVPPPPSAVPPAAPSPPLAAPPRPPPSAPLPRAP